MTIKRYAAQILRGLSTDAKPMTGVLPDTMFIETDTSLFYFWDDMMGEWMEHHASAPNTSMMASYTIYLDGIDVNARNNRTGMVEFTGDNTVDASPAINYAINNIKNLDGIDAAHGGRVSIAAGKYKCKTTISVQTTVAGRNSIQIEGEGKGTFLSFEPTTTLPDAILFETNFPRLAHVLVAANDKVVNLVHGRGGTTANTQQNWGVLEHVTLCGPDSTIQGGQAGTLKATVKDPGPPIVYYTPVSGQIGLLLQGTHDANGYFTANWKITNCEFFALDIGCKVMGWFADMCNHDNIHCGGCNIGYMMEGVQHNLSNFRIEGGGGPQADQAGDIGIWLTKNPSAGSGADVTMMSNINIELHKLTGKGIVIDTPTNNTRISNIYDSSADDLDNFTIWDNARVPGSNFQDMINQSVGRINQGRSRVGSINYGFHRRGEEDGILKGNVHTVHATTSTVSTPDADLPISPFPNGPFGSLQTTTTLNHVACVYYNNTLGNVINNGQFPQLYVRFIPNSTANIRIFMGLWNAFTAPTGGGNPLNTRKGVGLYLDTGVSNNWKITHNDGGATATIIDFPSKTIGNLAYGPNTISASFVQALTVRFNNTNPSVYVRHHGLGYDYKTTNIPTTTALGFLIYLENLTAGAQRTFRLFDIEFGVICV